MKITYSRTFARWITIKSVPLKIYVKHTASTGLLPHLSIDEVKTKRQNLFLIFENDHSKLRILVYSRLGNQRIWPFVVTATILAVIAQCDSLISTFHHTIKVQILHTTKNLRLFMRISDGAWRWTWSWTGERRTSHRWSFAFHKNEWIRRINKWS